MHAAFDGVDVVGVREDLLGVRVGVLHRDFDVDSVALGVRRNDRMQRVFLFVEPFDERDDAAVELVVALARLFAALVAQRDREAAVEERELAQALLQDVPVKLGDFEHLAVGKEPLDRSGAFDAADLLELLHGDAALELHFVEPAVALDARHHPLRERVDHRDPDAVKAARNFVSALAELAAGVQDRHHDFDRRHLLFGVDVDGNAASVVFDRTAAVFEERHFDVLGVARQRFVDGVVDRFVDELVQAALGGVADVHARTFANRFEAA